MTMWIVGILLILLGILGLASVLEIGLILSVIFIILGLAAVAWDRGAFSRRR